MVQKKQKRTRGRPRQFDESEALDQAIDVFWELGYEAADIETLCQKMGLSKPSIYNSFGRKEDLFLMALERYGETISKRPQDALFRAKSPEKGLHAYFSTIAKDVSGQRHPSGCLLGCIAMPAAARMPKVAKVLRASFGSSATRLTAYFESEVEKGMLPAAFNVLGAVSLMQDLIVAMAMQGRTGASLAQLKRTAVRNVELVMFEGGQDLPK